MQTRASPEVGLLRRLAQQVNLPNYSTLPKSQLFQKLQEEYDIDRLIRAEHRSVAKEEEEIKERKKRAREEEGDAMASSSSSASQPKEKEKLNRLDPIMLCKIHKKRHFLHTRPNGTRVRFNLGSLIDYLISSGDFADPQTRIPFTDKELTTIDDLAKRKGLVKPSVLEAKNNVSTYSSAKCRKDSLHAVEVCAGEMITNMLEIAETFDPDDGQVELITVVFPTFMDLYRQLKEADAEYASKCMAQWQQFIKGPPNKPNYDDFGMIKVVSNFLRECER